MYAHTYSQLVWNSDSPTKDYVMQDGCSFTGSVFLGGFLCQIKIGILSVAGHFGGA